MEDDLKILKVKYLSNHLLDRIRIQMSKPYFTNPLNENDLKACRI